MSLPRSMVVDTHDAPLGATEAAVCATLPELVLRGLGAVALDYPRARLCVEGPGSKALRDAAEKLGAKLEDATGTTLRLRPSALIERQRNDRVLSVAGAVRTPRVLFVRGEQRVRELVAPGATTPAWVALWGNVEVDRNDTIDALIDANPYAARLLLVLPARHAHVRRARTPLAQLVRQVRSACASCGACAPVCPSSVALPSILRSIAGTKRTRVPARELATAASCTGCAACDAACPSSLSPLRIVGEVGRRLRDRGVAAATARAPIFDADLAQLRAGLGRYARPPLHIE